MNVFSRHLLNGIISLVLLIASQACASTPATPFLPFGTSTPFLPESVSVGTPSPSTPIPANPTVAPTAAQPPTLVPVTYPIGPSGFPADVDPLTGLRVSDPSILNRRPLAIKVSNFPRTARLVQSGLNNADLLWEFYTEYGNTRFMAMYYGKESDKVGPIRSARIIDLRIVPLYDAIVVHVEAAQIVQDAIAISGLSTINEFPASCPAICRDPSVPEGVNSAFGNTVALTTYAQRVGMLSGGKPNLDGMLFDLKPPAGGTPSTGAWIQFAPYSLAEWKYDPASNRYLRFSDSGDSITATIPLLDYSTGSQVAVDNVVILFAPINRYARVNPASGEVWDANLSGPGKAFFFRDGNIVEGTWKSGGSGSPLQFFDKSGNPFPLHPGSTYFGLLSDRGIGNNTGSTEWQFYDSH